MLAGFRDTWAYRPCCSSTCCSSWSVAAIGGLWPGLLAPSAGSCSLNYYFTPPLYTFTITEGENLLALLVFLAVAGRVAVTSVWRRGGLPREREREPRRRRWRGSPDRRPRSRQVLENLRRVFGLEGAAVLHREEEVAVEASAGERVPDAPRAATVAVAVDDRHVSCCAAGR